MHFIPSSFSIDNSINPELLKEKVDGIKSQYEYVIIDGAGGIDREATAAIKASDFVLIVVNPDVASVIASIKIIEMTRQLNLPIIGLVVNKFEHKKHGIHLERIRELCESPVIAVIPFDRKLPRLVSEMTPMILHDPKSRVSQSIVNLASHIVGMPTVERPSIWQKIVRIFQRKPLIVEEPSTYSRVP